MLVVAPDSKACVLNCSLRLWLMPFRARLCSAAVPVAFPSGITPPTQGIRPNRFERIVPPAVRFSVAWMAPVAHAVRCGEQKKVVEETIDTLRKITIHHVDYNYGSIPANAAILFHCELIVRLCLLQSLLRWRRRLKWTSWPSGASSRPRPTRSARR